MSKRRKSKKKKQVARVHREIEMRGLTMSDAQLLASAQRLLKMNEKKS